MNDHPYTNYLLARIYMMKEDYPEAKTTVEKVLKVYPDAGPAKQMLKMIETKMDGKANK